MKLFMECLKIKEMVDFHSKSMPLVRSNYCSVSRETKKSYGALGQKIELCLFSPLAAYGLELQLLQYDISLLIVLLLQQRTTSSKLEPFRYEQTVSCPTLRQRACMRRACPDVGAGREQTFAGSSGRKFCAMSPVQDWFTVRQAPAGLFRRPVISSQRRH